MPGLSRGFLKFVMWNPGFSEKVIIISEILLKRLTEGEEYATIKEQYIYKEESKP